MNAATASPVREALKRVVPERLRERVRRLLHPRRFHLHPALSRYIPERHSVLTWMRYEAGYHFWRHTRGRGQRLKRPIFMIGCPRSGTTIAVRLFALHPDVANFSEAPEIWDPHHYMDYEADHYWTAAAVRPEDAARLHARFEYHRRWHGKLRFLNKYPRSSVRLDYIRAVFPDAVFIHVVRDGRAVAASMLAFIRRSPRRQHGPMPFCHPPNWRGLVREDKLEQVALQWREIVQHIRSKRVELGAAYHEFRYEELCENPRQVLEAAYRFAGLPVDEDVLGRLPARLDSTNYKWKTELNPEQIEKLLRIEGPLLAELGYTL